MTILIEIRPEVQAEIARQAAANGRAVEAHAASLLEQAVLSTPADNLPPHDLKRAQAAGARIREISQGLTLGGLTIRELIDEGRR